jgi:hypothetical protein
MDTLTGRRTCHTVGHSNCCVISGKLIQQYGGRDFCQYPLLFWRSNYMLIVHVQSPVMLLHAATCSTARRSIEHTHPPPGCYKFSRYKTGKLDANSTSNSTSTPGQEGGSSQPGSSGSDDSKPLLVAPAGVDTASVMALAEAFYWVSSKPRPPANMILLSLILGVVLLLYQEELSGRKSCQWV